MKAPSELRSTLPAADAWCRACGNGGLQSFSRSSGIPVNNARVFTRREEALQVPTGDLELYCHDGEYGITELEEPMFVIDFSSSALTRSG